MSIIQSTLLFIFITPFVLATIMACSRSRRPAGSLREPPEPTLKVGGLHSLDSEFSWGFVDVELTVRRLAEAMAALARTNRVRLEFAACSNLLAHIDPVILTTALQEIVRTAIHAAPAGAVLITATNLDRELQIRITDDGAATDQRTRKGLIRDAEALIAMQGGSIVIECRQGQSTTMELRLPGVVQSPISSSDEDADEIMDSIGHSQRELTPT